MTEEEWLTCPDPIRMLRLLQGKISDRKLRLFACACCHRIWQYITDPGSRAIVEIAEQIADGQIDVQRILSLDYDRLTDDCGGPKEVHRCAFMVAGHVGHDILAALHGSIGASDVFEEAMNTSEGAIQAASISYQLPNDNQARFYQSKDLMEAGRRARAKTESEFLARQAFEQAGQSSLLRCIFGNPFRMVRAVPFDQASAITTLAQSIYDQRRFEDLPILADTLVEAGCTDDEVLNHCRSITPHARGCWVLDLLLANA